MSNALLYDFSQPSGYVHPYPLITMAPVTNTFTGYTTTSPLDNLIPDSDLVYEPQLFFRSGMDSTVIIPVGGSQYVYFLIPTTYPTTADSFYFNSFPVRQIDFGFVSLAINGVTQTFHLYRSEFTQSGNNITFIVKRTT